VKRRIKVGLRLGGAHRDADVGRAVRPLIFVVPVIPANSIMPAKATPQSISRAGLPSNDQRISEVDAVVRGLILGVTPGVP